MNRFERGYRAALADVLSLVMLYRATNKDIAADLSRLLRSPGVTEDDRRHAATSAGAILHCGQAAAADHILELIEQMPRRAA